MPNWKKVITSGSAAELSSLIAPSITGSLLGTSSFALTASYFSGSISNAINADTASYVNPLHQNVIITGSLIMSGSINNPSYIQFNTSSTVPAIPGTLSWDDGSGTLNVLLKGGNVDLQIGQENVVRVFNGSGTTLNEGEVVYVSGSQGNRPLVDRAIATFDGYSATTLGIVTEPISAGAEGFVTTFGMVNNINTLGTNGGDPVWLSPTTPGAWTTTQPSAPGHTVLLGYIVRVDNNVGSIFVHISNGWELKELHDVKDTTSSSSYGDLLVKSGSLWITTKQLTGSYSITGSLLLTSSYISKVDYIDFTNLSSSLPADTHGRLYWDTNRGSLSIGMNAGNVVQQVGLENYYYVRNNTGVTINKGQVVRAAGALGTSGRLLIDLMIADGTFPYYFALGQASEDIPNGNDGYVTLFGSIENIDTSGTPYGETWNDGDILYISPNTLGGLTNIPPEAPNLRIQLAVVLDAAVSPTGSLFVRPDLGSDLESLHDVIDNTTSTSHGDLLVKSGSVWISLKQLTGSYGLTGSLTATSFTGSIFGTSSWAQNSITASFVQTASYVTLAQTASYIELAQTASYVLNAISASYVLNAVSSSFSSTASYYEETDPVFVAQSASLATTASNYFKGNQIISGSLQLDPTDDPGGSNTTSSFFFVSASGDNTEFNLHYRNNGALWETHWLEERTDTGLVWGGVVTFAGTTMSITPGAGLIVNHNASTSSHGDTIPTYVQFGPITASATFITASQLTYLLIDANGNLVQQTSAFTPQQFNEAFPLGYITHLTTASISAYADSRVTTYGQNEQQSQFVRAFGPLKISGFDITPQSGSLKISIASGRTYRYGGFYKQDPQNPSIFDSNIVPTGSLIRLQKDPTAIGGFRALTNGGLPFTSIDPTKWDDGSGTLQTVGANEWTIQRIFQGSVNGLSYIYYGQSIYDSLNSAVQSITTEPFEESTATQIALPFIGYIITRGNTTDIGDTTNNKIINSGLFRNTAGSSGGGGVATTTLNDLSDVTITSATNGQALIYNAGSWINGIPTNATSASYTQTASYIELAQTASYILNAVSSSFASTAQTASYVLNSVSSSFATTASYASFAVTASLSNTASFVTASNVHGPYGINSVITSSYSVTASFALNAVTTTFNAIIVSGSNYTSSINDFVLVSASSHAVLLPKATANATVAVKWIVPPTTASIRTSGSGVTIDGIDRSTTGLGVYNQWDAYSFITDGINWYITG